MQEKGKGRQIIQMANGYNMRNIAEAMLLLGVGLALHDGENKWIQTCISGHRQSPIDVGDGRGTVEELVTVSPFNSSYIPLSLHYPPIDPTYTSHQAGSSYLLTHLQGGFTAVPIGSTTPVRYAIERVEFRTPSEHLIRGKGYELEMQLIHRGEDGSKAGLAVWYERSEKGSSVLEAIMQDSPLSFLSEFGGKIADFHFYAGSQTSPPCAEDMTWFLIGAKSATMRQINYFKQMGAGAANAREVQKTNGRWVYHMISGEQRAFLPEITD